MTELKKAGEFTPEELKALRVKETEEKLAIMEILNSISVPVQATVYTHSASWNIRNKAFWESFKQKDEQILEFMEKFLTEQK